MAPAPLNRTANITARAITKKEKAGLVACVRVTQQIESIFGFILEVKRVIQQNNRCIIIALIDEIKMTLLLQFVRSPTCRHTQLDRPVRLFQLWEGQIVVWEFKA